MSSNSIAGSRSLYVIVIILAGVAFLAGRATVQPETRVAIAEKGAVVVEAVLSRPEATPEVIEREIRAPVMRVLSRYAEEGYTVVDVSMDEQGLLAVAAVPANAVDITSELRDAVGLPKLKRPTPAPATAIDAAAIAASGSVR